MNTLRLDKNNIKYPFDLGATSKIDDQRIIYFGDKNIKIVDSWEHLCKSELEVSKESIWEFLQIGFVVPPKTIFTNVFKVPFGYRAILTSLNSIKLVDEFPYDHQKNAENSDYSDEKMIDEMVHAVHHNISSNMDAVLLHSGGKDSNLIALAIEKLGLTSVRCVSYEGGYRDSESSSSEAIASYFQLEQETITANPLGEFKALNKLLDIVHNLSCDFSLPAFAYVAEKVKAKTVFIDGLGNDIYMGYLDTPVEKMIQNFNFSKFRILEPSKLGKSDFINYGINSLFMCRTSRTFPGSRLSENETKKLLKKNYDSLTHKFKGLAKKQIFYGKDNFRARTRGRLCDDAMFMEKSRMMAYLNGGKVVFPFADHRLSKYLYNLPNAKKYNKKNKIIFRDILDKKLPDTSYIHKKSGLRFNMENFININKEEVINTIHTCDIFDTEFSKVFLKIHFRKLNYISAQKIYLVYCMAYWWNSNSFKFSEKKVDITYE